MVSASCDEITTHFIKEFRKLNDGYGLIVTRYEFGKLYDNTYAVLLLNVGSIASNVEISWKEIGFKELRWSIKDMDKALEYRRKH